MGNTLSSWLMIMSHSSVYFSSMLLCFAFVGHLSRLVTDCRLGSGQYDTRSMSWKENGVDTEPAYLATSPAVRWRPHPCNCKSAFSNVDRPVSSFQKIRTVLQLQGSSLHSGLANFAWHWSNQCMIFNFIFMARSDKKDDSMSYKSVLRSCNKLLCRNSAGHLPINEHLRWWSYATLKMENILSASGVS